MSPSAPWLRSLRRSWTYGMKTRPTVTGLEPVSDATLTAFCQLGALRIGTRRCMLFFFDCENAYVLAEATRTLSLNDDEVHDIEDGLWLGTIVIPRGLSVCEYTVNIPRANHGSNRHEANAGIVHIINDLRDDTRFCDRPYVASGPKARFYAGVPITTPAGVRIGAFCVLDDKPREGLSGRDVDFLVDMSKTVMDHLEIIRARSEFGRGSNILSSLGSFFGETPDQDCGSSSKQTLRPHRHGRDDGARSTSTPKTTSTIDHAQLSENEASPDPRSINRSVSYRRRLRKTRDTDGGVRDGVRGAFQTAAELIRGAMAVDGVMFLDASKRSCDGSISSSNHAIYTDNSADATMTTTDTAVTDDSQRSGPEECTRQPSIQSCAVLGQSIMSGSGSPSAPHGHITERLLSSLLRRYPAGKVWVFDADGDFSSSSENAQDINEDDGSSPMHPARETDDTDHFRRYQAHRTRGRLNASETQQLRALFNGVRSLCLTIMWDPVRGKVYGAALMWSFSSHRIFSPLGEMAYLRAFSDVIMAKIARIEAKMESKAKSNFISSISHELRSPLHGILGGIDFLYERKHLDWSIVSQIENCGTLLADVIEHLLDYSQVNGASRRLKGKHAGRTASDDRPSKGSAATRLSLGSLAKLTEEAADAVFYSHCCTSESESKIDYILDVSVEAAFRCRLSVGAWKRLCINIIGNALKYTRDGHIKVSLKISSRSRRRDVAVLTVTDTGCGMSKEFLENGLFRAFSQENSLANGTGLGMSLVAKLVKGFGGKMEVQSSKGVGTTVRVIVPLLTQSSTSPEGKSSTPHRGLRICIPSPSDAKASPPQGRDIQHATIVESLASQGVIMTRTDPQINIMFEADALALLRQRDGRAISKAPAIVLCDTFASATRLRDSQKTHVLGSHVEALTQPFGIQKLIGAIEKCLHQGTTRAPSNRNMQLGLSPRKDHQVKKLAIGKSVKRRTSSTPPGFRLRVARHEEIQVSTSHEAEKPGPIGLALPEKEAMVTATVVDSFPQPNINDSKGRPSLLLVDDNRINLRLLVAWADRNRYPHEVATNGQEAVDAYIASFSPSTTTREDNENDNPTTYRKKPNLILLDINMPVMDGFEAARRIRAFEAESQLPPAIIVALTGLGSAEARREAAECGIDVFLTKPVRPRELDKLLLGLGMGQKR